MLGFLGCWVSCVPGFLGCLGYLGFLDCWVAGLLGLLGYWVAIALVRACVGCVRRQACMQTLVHACLG